MTLTRWDPFYTANRLRDTMDRVFEDVFSRSNRLVWDDGLHILPIDMYETTNDLVIKAHVPGAEPGQVEITAERGTLTIQAHLVSDAEAEASKDYRWHHREVWAGDVSRTVALPAMVDADKAEASFKNGVLTLTIPKVEAAKPQQIPIKVSD